MRSDKIITQLPSLSPDRAKDIWFSAMRLLMSQKGDIEQAARVLDEIEAIERSKARPDPSVRVGELFFEPHGHGFVSFGYADGTCVVAIRKTAQHRLSGNAVYQVKFDEEVLSEACRSIDQARELAASEYSERVRHNG